MHLTSQESRTVIRNSYVPAKGAPVSPYQLPVGNVPAVFYDLILHMPRHHTAACIAMQLVTPSNSGKLPGILGVPQCTLEAPPYFQLQMPPNIYVSQHPSHCLAVAIQAPCKHPMVVIFFSLKY